MSVSLSVRWRLKALIITTLLVCGGPTLSGQTIPFSQRGSVSQSVGFTQISVEYGRPVARGRTLFPNVVKWGNTWNPGADSATRLSFSHDVTVNGRALAAGEYSLWLVPRENAPWSLIFHKASHVFHTPYPGDEGVALRVEVTPETSEHIETLAIYFPSVVRDSAVMRVHWGKTVVPVSITAPWRPPSDDNADGYFFTSVLGNIMWTPTLPSTSCVMRRSAVMLAS